MNTHETLTEQLVMMPIVNPETGGKSRSFQYAGKVDLVQDNVLIDWKTVADTQKYLQAQSIGYQCELYAAALEEQHGIRIKSAQYRLIQRPTIKYCGKDADRQAYEDRCVEWLTEKPHALVTEERMLNPVRMSAARHMLWNASKRILENRRTGVWLQNEAGCHTWGRECPYMSLCLAESRGSDVSDTIAASYCERQHAHSELGDVLGELEALTYSSTKTLGVCERKYYWSKERNLSPGQEETGTALYIGSAVHEGMEALIQSDEKSALERIDQWADENPVIGGDAFQRQEQDIARARAIVRVANMKWFDGADLVSTE